MWCLTMQYDWRHTSYITMLYVYMHENCSQQTLRIIVAIPSDVEKCQTEGFD